MPLRAPLVRRRPALRLPQPARPQLAVAAVLPQTVVLAGFYIEEIAGVRQLLDQIGAAEVRAGGVLRGGSGCCP